MEKETGRSQKQTYTYDRKSDLAVKKKKGGKGAKIKLTIFAVWASNILFCNLNAP